jgi:hypothetical protein
MYKFIVDFKDRDIFIHRNSSRLNGVKPKYLRRPIKMVFFVI